MIRIEYPYFDFKRMRSQDKDFIFDPIRKHWVRLTPEEWVRQNTIQYLVQTMNYPSSNFAIEKGTILDGLEKRCDLVVYKNGLPWLIVEFKAQEVKIDSKTLLQVLGYNRAIPVPYFCVTNGISVFLFGKNENGIVELSAFPRYIDVS